MKKLLLLSLLIVTGISFGQGFNRGYDVGWQTGYCYDASYGCMAPTTPFAPFPSIYESSTSYSDGYHRGLTDGMNKGRADRRAKSNSQMNSRQSYSKPQVINKYEPFVPDYEFYEKAMQKSQSRYQNAQKNTDASKEDARTKEVMAWVKDKNSESEKAKRQSLMKMIRSQISSFEYYPSSIPDGSYWPYYINETEYKSPKCLNSASGKSYKNDDCEQRMVFVANNKIILSSYKVANRGEREIDINFFGSDPFGFGRTVTSSSILKGVAGVREGYTYVNKQAAPCEHEIFYASSKEAKYYFLGYLQSYNDAQILLKKIQEKYKLVTTHSRISDGWHVAYLTNRKEFCDIRNVYVKNNKVVKWIGGQSDELIPNTGGEINNSKSTFSRKFPSDNETFGADKQWVEWTKYTWMNRPRTEIYDVYFINL